VGKKKRSLEPDIVSELQEDANWSSYTNTTVRGPERLRGRASGFGPGSRTVMRWIIFLVLGVLIATILVQVLRAAAS